MPGLTRSDSYTDYDDAQYDAYISSSSNAPKTSIILLAGFFCLSSTAFVILTTYLHFTGKHIFDSEGSDCSHFLMSFFGIASLVIIAILAHYIHNLRKTYGSAALLSNETWSEEFERPEDRKPVLSVVIISGFLLLSFIVGFTYSFTLTLSLATKEYDSGVSETIQQAHFWMFGSYIFMPMLGMITKSTYLRYRYNKQFSQEPLISGVYTNGHI